MRRPPSAEDIREHQRLYNRLQSQMLETITFGAQPRRLTLWQRAIAWWSRSWREIALGFIVAALFQLLFLYGLGWLQWTI